LGEGEGWKLVVAPASGWRRKKWKEGKSKDSSSHEGGSRRVVERGRIPLRIRPSRKEVKQKRERKLKILLCESFKLLPR